MNFISQWLEVFDPFFPTLVKTKIFGARGLDLPVDFYTLFAFNIPA